jgi:hypothetical protein
MVSVASWFSLFTSCFGSGFLYEALSASRLEQMGLLGSFGFGDYLHRLIPPVTTIGGLVGAIALVFIVYAGYKNQQQRSVATI